jgi:hypothetical protein
MKRQLSPVDSNQAILSAEWPSAGAIRVHLQRVPIVPIKTGDPQTDTKFTTQNA